MGTIASMHSIFLDILTPPFVFVDYTHNEITVTSWNKSVQVSKVDVVRAGTTGKLLNPKTSKHYIPNRPLRLFTLLQNLI